MLGNSFVNPLQASGCGMYASVRVPPDRANLLVEYRKVIADGKLIAYRPPTASITPQVKGSAFTGVGTGAVTGLLTTDTITAQGTAPTCSVNGTLTISADCWDVYVHRAGVLWAYLPGINVGQATELDASGNGHHLTLTTTTIGEAVNGTGTNYKNESGFASCTAAPIGFTWPATLPSINIHVDDNGVALAPGYDISAGRPTGKAYYVSATGSQANDGLTAGSPLQFLYTALVKPDVDVVYVAAGEYTRAKGWYELTLAPNPTRDISVIAVGGEAIITTYDVLSWAADVLYPGAYKTTRSNAYMVRDKSTLDADGISTECPLLASPTLVGETPNSFYTDGVSVWIHLHDSRTPDADVRVYLATENGMTLGTNIYIEGLTFEGGKNFGFVARNTTATNKLTRLKNVKSRFARLDGVAARGNVSIISENCVAEQNWLDGFNYHIEATYIPVAVEINCIGRKNGLTGNTHNGSTMHDGGTVVRIGGEYYGNLGPNVGDVNTGTLSWNLGVNAHDGIAPTDLSDFQLQVGKMWLHSCIGTNFVAQTGGEIFTYDTPTTVITPTPYSPTAGIAIPIVYGGPITTPGPLNVSATITAGTTYSAVTIKAPLGPEFQAITEWTGEAAVDLTSWTGSDQTRIGPRGMLIYDQPLTYADAVKADRYCGYSIPAEVVHLWNAADPTVGAIGPQPEYSAASTQPDANGNLVPWPVNIPGKGVGIYPAYSNLITAPFASLSAWSIFACTVVGNFIAPSTANVEHYIGSNLITPSIGTKYVFSVVLKAGGYNWITLTFHPSSFPDAGRRAWFNIGDGTLGTVEAGVIATIDSLGNGEYLCSIGAIADAAVSASLGIIGITNANNGGAFVGNPSLGIYASKYQCTTRYQLPYIPPGTPVASTAATSGGNGLAIPLNARMRECFERSVTDGVELVTNGTFDSNITGWTAGDAESIISWTAGQLRIENGDTTPAYVSLSGLTAIVGRTYRIRANWDYSPGGSVGIRLIFGGVTSIISASVRVADLIITATTTGGLIVSNGDGVEILGGYKLWDNISIQRLAPSVFTAAALVYMGVGSGEIPIVAPTYINILATMNNEYIGALYATKATDGSSQISRAYDGSVATGISATWNRGEIHLKAVQTNAAGTQFRVGNRRYTSAMVPIDALTWGAWVAYDGSFNPLTRLRFGYTSTVPLGFLQTQVWNKSCTDAEILNLLRYAV